MARYSLDLLVVIMKKKPELCLLILNNGFPFSSQIQITHPKIQITNIHLIFDKYATSRVQLFDLFKSTTILVTADTAL